MKLLTLFTLLLGLSLPPLCAIEIVHADVVVYTATASGVVASIAAAREGAHVVLVEPGRHLGGMLSGGLGHSDVDGQEHIIGGLAAEVYARMAKHYGKDAADGAFASLVGISKDPRSRLRGTGSDGALTSPNRFPKQDL